MAGSAWHYPWHTLEFVLTRALTLHLTLPRAVNADTGRGA
jgi:hypothetical protein